MAAPARQGPARRRARGSGVGAGSHARSKESHLRDPSIRGLVSRITGTGSAFPADSLTNAELIARHGLHGITPQWIVERTGIRERRISRPGDPRESCSSLAARAAQGALEMAGRRPEDVDMIVCATCTPDMPIPSTACLVQGKIGAAKAWAADVNAACAGFIYGLAQADHALVSGKGRVALVIGADVLSSFTNWRDPQSCVLFGDGAGAAVVEASASRGAELRWIWLGADGSAASLLEVPAGGSFLSTTPELQREGLDKMRMKGREIFRRSVTTMTEIARRGAEAAGLKIDDLAWIVPHQANLRILESVASRLEIPFSRFVVNIGGFGNTSAATIPTALDSAWRAGTIRPGDEVMGIGFGAGLTYGGFVARWGRTER